jgi:hypothetical protein
LDLQNLVRPYIAPYYETIAQIFVSNRSKRALLFCFPLLCFAAWATWYVRYNSFFWDTVQLAAQHAHFFYETNFTTLLLPDSMDSGHPPTFGIYLALIWIIFGKSLIVSHLSMLPFLCGIIWEAYKLGEKYLGEWQAVYFPLVLICNPIMASQAALVSPDVVLVYFFLLALNGICGQDRAYILNRFAIVIGILGLCVISMRGMMVAVLLFIFDILLDRSKVQETLKTSRTYAFIKPYILGGLFGFSFLLYHYIQKGWVGYHVNSEWAEAFQRVDSQGFIKNIVVYIWRLLDFGHVWLWLIIAYAFIKIRRLNFYKKEQSNIATNFNKAPNFVKISVESVKILRGGIFSKTKELILLLILSTIILSPTLLIYKGLLAHRYMLPIYLAINFLCLKLISDLKSGKVQNALYALTFVGLITGNFWVYPQPISTGWDSTLAHLPYYRLRSEMLTYIDTEKINRLDIGTAFPNIRPPQLVDLQDNVPFSKIDFEKNKYILYSNVMNDFSKDDL